VFQQAVPMTSDRLFDFGAKLLKEIGHKKHEERKISRDSMHHGSFL